MQVINLDFLPNGLVLYFNDGTTVTASHAIRDGVLSLEGLNLEQQLALDAFNRRIDGSARLDPRFFGAADDADTGLEPGILYWTDVQSDAKVWQSQLDGTSIRQIIDIGDDIDTLLDPNPLQPLSPIDIKVNPVTNKVNIGVSNLSYSTFQSQLDGSSPIVLTGGTLIPGESKTLTGIDIDTGSNLLYTITILGEINRFNAQNGSMMTTLALGTGGSYRWLSKVGHYLYTTITSPSKIVRFDLNNFVWETIKEGLTSIAGFAVDKVNDRLYFAEKGGINTISRSDLDGSNTETCVIGAPADGIAVDNFNGKIYWTQSADSLIRRANLNGEIPQTALALPTIQRPYAITIGEAPVTG